MTTIRYFLCLLLLSAWMARPAGAQEPALDRARMLVETGQVLAQQSRPADALLAFQQAMVILQGLPQTREVAGWRAQAHLGAAFQMEPTQRCKHFESARDYASVASSGELIEIARRSLVDQGCPTGSLGRQ